MLDSLQEQFWAGEFGDLYIEQNNSPNLVAAATALFAKILHHTGKVESICELGANIGLNLMALHTLLPQAKLTGVEINKKAAERLAALSYVTAIHSSIYDMQQECGPGSMGQYDLVFTSGVLIHQGPEFLDKAYQVLYQASKRYIIINEYYNPKPVEVEYRGNKSVLFKRDFAGELLDRYSDLVLLDYGFTYHRDAHFSGDDSTWFLMEKR